MNCGPDWYWSVIEQAVDIEPHHSALGVAHSASAQEDIRYHVEEGFSHIIPWKEMKKLKPKICKPPFHHYPLLPAISPHNFTIPRIKIRPLQISKPLIFQVWYFLTFPNHIDNNLRKQQFQGTCLLDLKVHYWQLCNYLLIWFPEHHFLCHFL